MKTHAFLSFFFCLAASAGTTCPKFTKSEFTCKSSHDQQYDFCKKQGSGYQIRINGEVYSQNAKKNNFDGLVQFQGTNYEKVRFIAELAPKEKKGTLTEVNKYEMPVGDAVELSCAKH